MVQFAKGVSGCAPSWENKCVPREMQQPVDEKSVPNRLTRQRCRREGYHPSHNVSPGTRMPVLRKVAAGAAESSADLTLHTMRWGLVPSFTKATDSPDFWKVRAVYLNTPSLKQPPMLQPSHALGLRRRCSTRAPRACCSGPCSRA